MEVRRARPDEWPVVAGLLALLDRPDLADPERAERFRGPYLQLLENPNAAAFVAEVDERVVGVLTMEFRQRFTHTLPQGWLTNAAVEPDSRSQGVGAALFAAADAAARERGCARMSFESSLHRTRAHDLFRRLGWSEHGIAFAKWLE